RPAARFAAALGGKSYAIGADIDTSNADNDTITVDTFLAALAGNDISFDNCDFRHYRNGIALAVIDQFRSHFMENLSSKLFKNQFVDTFPGDDSGNVRPRQTPGVLYSK